MTDSQLVRCLGGRRSGFTYRDKSFFLEASFVAEFCQNRRRPSALVLGEDSVNDDEIRGWSASVQTMFRDIEQIAGFAPPQAMVDGFFALQLHIMEAVPRSLAHLQPAEENSPDWLYRFRQAVLSSVQEGLYASLYHLSRIEAIESRVLAIAQQHAPGLGMPAPSAAGGGNSRALDCEYQAFVFALRRTLEYLAVAIAAFFKAECHSFRRLPRAIKGLQPVEARDAVQAILDKRLNTLQDLLPGDKHAGRSLRDRLAHWESIRAGSFSLSRSGRGYEVAFIGGGHNLPVFRPRPEVPAPSGPNISLVYAALGPVLREQYLRVEATVLDLLACLGLPTPPGGGATGPDRAVQR